MDDHGPSGPHRIRRFRRVSVSHLRCVPSRAIVVRMKAKNIVLVLLASLATACAGSVCHKTHSDCLYDAQTPEGCPAWANEVSCVDDNTDAGSDSAPDSGPTMCFAAVLPGGHEEWIPCPATDVTAQ